MPNWCYNTLTISGEPKQLNKLLKKIEVTKSEATHHEKKTKFSFNNVIPMPTELYENEGWYSWRNANWGTKWNANVEYETTSNWENGEVVIEFNTAWSPPDPIIKTLVKEFPKLYFHHRYYEESNAYWGSFSYDKGECVERYEGEFKTCAEFNEFGLTHHICKICENYLHEYCNHSDKQEVDMCNECKDQQEQQDLELSELDKELWG